MLNQINIVHEDLRIVQAFKRVQQVINSITFSPIVGSAGISNILFVDQVTGNDATAVVGSLVNKFATIQGAFNKITTDAIPNRVVFVSPGTYNENIIWPAIENVTLQGSGEYNTFVLGLVAANPTLTINPAVTITTAQIKDIDIVPTTNTGIFVDGTPSGGQLFTNILSIQNVFLSNNPAINCFDIQGVNNVMMDNITFGIGTVKNISLFSGYQLESLNGTLNANYDPASLLPTNGKIAYFLDSSTIANLNATNIVKVIATPDCNFNTSITGTFIDTATDHAELDIKSTIGNVVITFSHTNADNDVADFNLATINGVFNISASGGTHRGLVSAKNAVIKNIAVSITAGNLTTMDIRGAQFEQAQLVSAGSGTIDRTIHRVTSATPITPAGLAINIVPPFSGTNYTVISELTPPDVGAGLIVGVNAKSGSQFSVLSNVVGAASVNFLLIEGN